MIMKNELGLDVIVIGGGPSGSSTATILAQHGLKVRLFEREKGARFHIGESLMPDTYWTLRRMGVIEKIKASSTGRKHSEEARKKMSIIRAAAFAAKPEIHRRCLLDGIQN